MKIAEAEKVLIEQCGLTRSEAELLLEFLTKETLTQVEARIVDDIYAHLTSFWSGRTVEAAIHGEMMALGLEHDADPEALERSFLAGFILPAEVGV